MSLVPVCSGTTPPVARSSVPETPAQSPRAERRGKGEKGARRQDVSRFDGDSWALETVSVICSVLDERSAMSRFEIPRHWSPTEALAVLDFLEHLHNVILDQYEGRVLAMVMRRSGPPSPLPDPLPHDVGDIPF